MSTATQVLAVPRNSVLTRARDYAELTKLRVTTLIAMTAWCGYYFGALKSGNSSLSWHLFHALLGIALISGGTAALNEVVERDTDGDMRRTAQRPLPAGRMTLLHAILVGSVMTIGGALYLGLALNPLTGFLSLATSAVYLAAYTPLKKIHPICTFVGAFPGAMPGVLGWTAARGRLDWGALVMFAVVFFWQFPHFQAIAWMYREDYEAAGIKMLPVVDKAGHSVIRQMFTYCSTLISVSLVPSLLRMTGKIYLFGALVLGLGFLWFNCHPAQVFMGDTGALAIGGALGTVAILLKAEFLLLIAGGVFAAEAVSVIMQTGVYRWRKRRYGKEYADAHKVFRMAPLHHHFEKLGWAEPQVVMRFYILGVLCAMIALATLKVR